ncbi:MAG TPA: hypothetical protein VLE03_09805 [Nitrospiraceae bacterium]|nr:hypothetical protein [Nitrospiraceae bacterium]
MRGILGSVLINETESLELEKRGFRREHSLDHLLLACRLNYDRGATP